MSVTEFKILHTICKVERTQLLTILARFGKNPQLAGFFLTQNRSKFYMSKAQLPFLNDFPHHLSPFYIAEQGYDKILVT